MKNPFQRNDHRLLIGGLLLGAAAIGAAVYLFREEIAGLIDELLDKKPEAKTSPATQDYLEHPAKAPKTDREKLRHHQILHEPQTKEERGEGGQS